MVLLARVEGEVQLVKMVCLVYQEEMVPKENRELDSLVAQGHKDLQAWVESLVITFSYVGFFQFQILWSSFFMGCLTEKGKYTKKHYFKFFIINIKTMAKMHYRNDNWNNQWPSLLFPEFLIKYLQIKSWVIRKVCSPCLDFKSSKYKLQINALTLNSDSPHIDNTFFWQKKQVLYSSLNPWKMLTID